MHHCHFRLSTMSVCSYTLLGNAPDLVINRTGPWLVMCLSDLFLRFFANGMEECYHLCAYRWHPMTSIRQALLPVIKFSFCIPSRDIFHVIHAKHVHRHGLSATHTRQHEVRKRSLLASNRSALMKLRFWKYRPASITCPCPEPT